MNRALCILPFLAFAFAGCEAATSDDVANDSISQCHSGPPLPGSPALSQRASGPPSTVVAFVPPPLPPYEGPLTVNDRLGGAERFGEDVLLRAEDIVVDAHGRLYTGAEDGHVWRATLGADGRPAKFEPFADLGQHALGLAFDPCGNLIAAVPNRGIVAIAPDGAARTLADRVDGTRLEYADEVAVARDGTIYVTDASTKYERGWPHDFLEGRPNGRVVAYEPETGETRVVVSDLYFANGIVVADDESYILFAETWRGWIRRHWLTGDKAGTTETFAENLSVTPDNITRDATGRIWVAGQRRTAQLDGLSASAEARLALLTNPPPGFETPPGDPHVLVVVLDADGRVLAGLHDTSGGAFPVSSAVPHGNSLFLGTNVARGIARVALPEL